MGALCTHLVRLPPEKANMELARKMNEKVVLQFQFLDDWLQTRYILKIFTLLLLIIFRKFIR
eukprot:UN10173